MEALLEAGVRLSLPLVLAAIAGLFCERSGVLNVGLEGLILGGAFFAAWGTVLSGSWFTGIGMALAYGLLAGFLLAFVMVLLRADQIVVGILFNLFMLGVTSYLLSVVTRSDPGAVASGRLPRLAVPGLAELPYIGPALFNQTVLTYVTFGLIAAAWLLLFRTGGGIRLRAAGEYAEGARSVGVNVLRTRMAVVSTSSMVASLGGAFLVLAHAGRFSDDLSAGRGYVALAVIILARWHPIGALFAALLLGGADALQLRLQAGGLGVPVQFALAFPYVVTLIAVAILGKRVRPPAELGKPMNWKT